MQATADSNTNNKYWANPIIGNKIHLLVANCVPKRFSNKCPAIIFAANRTDNVIGRITFLTSSIKTMKGINTGGVPEGTKWAKKCVRLFTSLYKMKDSHKGRAKAKVIARWLVAVNVKENNPKVLLNKISINSEINKIILILLFLSSVENSLFITKMIFLIITFTGLFKIQNEGKNNKININILIQFKGKKRIAAGSKIENKLFIIFRRNHF